MTSQRSRHPYILISPEVSMCGRAYSTYTDEELEFIYLNRKGRWPSRRRSSSIKPNYNVCPAQTIPVLRVMDGALDLDEMRWGYVPEWEPEFKTKFKTFNSKSERVFESPMYKMAIMQRRCLVPVSGFIEWEKDSNSQRPFKIFLKDSPIMTLAGIWTRWRAGTPDEKRSCAIMITSPNKFMAEIHERMPVILQEGQFDDWLDPEIHEVDQIKAMLKPCPEDWLEAVRISTLINKIEHNRPEVLEPISIGGPGILRG